MLFCIVFISHFLLFAFLKEAVRLPDQTNLILIFINLGIFATVLELWFPRKKDFKPTKFDMSLNMFFLAFDQFLLRPFLGIYTLFVFVPFLQKTFMVLHLYQLWRSSWPFYVQSLLIFLLMTFSTYWAHRLMHIVPLFWHFHRLHHVSQKLNWFVTFWNHPLHSLMIFSFAMFFPILFAIPEPILIYPILITVLVSTLNHANFKMEPTSLNYFFPSVLEHEIHHSMNFKEAGHNYGVSFLLWDHVFNTYKSPQQSVTEEVGVKGWEGNNQDKKRYTLFVLRDFIWPFRKLK
jgi:sterol desaturase/sphingolipid hydroxylase (fatty acid hydroxylase superfamily)